MTAATKTHYSPFPDSEPVAVAGPAGTAAPAPRTPFAKTFLDELSFESDVNGIESEYAAFVTELYDRELDESIHELSAEAAAVISQSAGWDDVRRQERLLSEHFAPLAREVDRLFEIRPTWIEGEWQDIPSQAQLEALFDGYVPSTRLSPSFENFFGKLTKLVKNAVKKGVNLVKKGVSAVSKLGLSGVLEKIKPIAQKMLRRVLDAAINKLPEKLRPMAKSLRAKYLKGIEGETVEPQEVVTDLTQIQQEFNESVAEVMFTGETTMSDRPDQEQDSPIAQLNEARAKLIDGLERLGEHEDPRPHIERFLPAILPVLKIAITMIGRQKVVDFLAKLVAKLVERLVGPQFAQPLSQAIVDVGLGLIGLEVTPESRRRIAAEAVAATVEETVRRLQDIPPYAFEDTAVLEGFVVSAFEAAAADVLPPILPASEYEANPDLSATSRMHGAWMYQPGEARVKVFQKFSRRPEVTITPHLARSVKTFGGASLGAYLDRKYGRSGRPLRGRLTLVRTLPGTTLAHIAAAERQGPQPLAETLDDYHPLTREAAAVLLQEPGLGRELSDEVLADPLRTSAGETFYRLELLDGERPAALSYARRSSEVNIVLDFPAAQFRVYVFLDEDFIQRVAAGLRGGNATSVGTLASSVHALLRERVPASVAGGVNGHTRIIHERVTAAQALGQAMSRLPLGVHRELRNRLTEWTSRGISELLQRNGDRVRAAADADDYGVTIEVEISHVPGIERLRNAFGAMPVSTAGAWLSGSEPELRAHVSPGYRRG